MGALPLMPDGALGTPRYNYRYPSLVPRVKLEDDVSPKSVITDIRFISPVSSSSSSMDRRPLSDSQNIVKLPQPSHDRGYSISDGECSDQETLLESSRELNKIFANSGSLESLPETHSLALKATRTNICKGDGSSNGRLHQTCALVPVIEDKHQIQHSKRTHQTVTLRDDALVQDRMSISSADIHTGSGSSQLNFGSGVLPSQNSSLLNRSSEEEDRGASTVRSPQLEVVNAFENPGTPRRFFPVWQSQVGSPVGSHISMGSPGVEKGIGSYSPAGLAENLTRGVPFQHRFLSGPLHGGISLRHPPSKWDDAEKWIASPGHNESPPQPQLHRLVQALPPGRRHSISGHCHRPNFGVGSPDFSIANVEEKLLAPQSFDTPGRGQILTRSASQNKRAKALSFGDLSKRVFDLSCSESTQTTDHLPRLDGGAANIEESLEQGAQSDEVIDADGRREAPSLIPSIQSRKCGISELLEEDKSKTPANAKCFDKSMDVEILKHALTESMKESGSHQLQTSYPADRLPPSGHSWKFGKRMSSTESQTTSVFAAASPTRHNTPAACSGRRPASCGSFAGAGVLELQPWKLVALELSKLSDDDDRNLAAWSTREEEDMECSVSLRDHDSGLLQKGFVDDKAAAWGEAEHTKHNERCDKEEARIQAWEELQTSKAEDDMQKIEMKIEKMRARALEKMTNRIAITKKKAKEMRASAQSTKSENSAKTVQQVEQIRITGRDVSPILKSSFKCCFHTLPLTSIRSLHCRVPSDAQT